MTSRKIRDISSEKDLEFSYELKIPKERVAVLIGKKGEVKKRIEEAANIKLKIDSEEGDVVITGNDSMGLYSAREIVHAIARGFNPDIAMQLIKQDYMMETIDLRDYAPNKNDMIRLKGRVIGMEGKSRRVIEEMTETNISVYGKTIAIIGEITSVGIAKHAVEMLLEGGMHAGIYRELEKKRREMKLRRVEETFNLIKK